ncbi:MAG: AgmX/PglI C-terminal domain-containing protein, partial [Sandaracinaceae bacterium]
ENVTIPTNLDVQDAVRTRFGEFYAALFDATVERNPGAVVTEYAWGATGCDPCPGPSLSPTDIASLGADVTHPGAQAGGGLSGQQASVPRVGAPVPVVSGRLSAEVVRRIVRRHINEVRFCYERQLSATPTLAGSVTTRFTLSSTGAVSAASVTATTLNDTAAETCIADAIRRWTFPQPEAGEVSVEQRFDLTTSGSSSAPGGYFGFGGGPFSDFVLTRLHYRYGRESLGEDLVFRAAGPIVGGREMRDAEGQLEHGAIPAPFGGSTFQARYAIRHAWEGAIECEQPRRGIWGGPPDGTPTPSPAAAREVASAPRGRTPLGSLLVAPLPEAGVAETTPPPVDEAEEVEEAEVASPEAAEPETPAEAADVAPAPGCGCRTVTREDAAPGLALLALVAFVQLIRKRR